APTKSRSSGSSPASEAAPNAGPPDGRKARGGRSKVGRGLTNVKPLRRHPGSNSGMNPVLHAVSRLLDSQQANLRDSPAGELAATLADEPRLRMATRLALVKLAARCEQPDPVPPGQARACMLCAPLLARQLDRLSTLSEIEAM